MSDPMYNIQKKGVDNANRIKKLEELVGDLTKLAKATSEATQANTQWLKLCDKAIKDLMIRYTKSLKPEKKSILDIILGR